MAARSPPKDGTVLYYVPPSFYSQVARLGLEEKGVKYSRIVVGPGPPTYETYQPWYMRLNPMGTVPTLLVDGESIDDSRRILNFIDKRFEGPPLIPADAAQRAKVEYWVEEAYQVPERVLAYGKGKLKAVGEKSNRGRLKALKKWRTKMPEMEAIYDHKIADIELFMRHAADVEEVEAAWATVREKLDRLDADLAENQFCCGDSYSLADVLWTVTIARQIMLEGNPCDDRASLHAWFERMKERPSFKTADVWTRFKPEVMLPILIIKFKWQVLGMLGVLGLAVAGLYSIFSQ